MTSELNLENELKAVKRLVHTNPALSASQAELTLQKGLKRYLDLNSVSSKKSDLENLKKAIQTIECPNFKIDPLTCAIELVNSLCSAIKAISIDGSSRPTDLEAGLVYEALIYIISSLDLATVDTTKGFSYRYVPGSKGRLEQSDYDFYKTNEHSFFKAQSITKRIYKIHRDAVGLSLRKSFPLLGLLNPIDYRVHQIELDGLIGQIENLENTFDSDCKLAVSFLDFLRHLGELAVILQRICDYLNSKHMGDLSRFKTYDFKIDNRTCEHTAEICRARGLKVSHQINKLMHGTNKIDLGRIEP